MDPKPDYLDRLLVFCCENKATDLHLCVGSKPMMRVNAKLTVMPHTDLISPMAMNLIVDTLLNQKKYELLRANRVLDFSFSRTGLGRFRCNVYQQRGTYAIAIRMLPFDIPPFAALGLPPAVSGFAAKSQGLVLITGVPGSGKSTTLASLIDIINQKDTYHIITIEDPIEYLHRHKHSLVMQREIGEDADSLASALHATLREDPDIIMVGEMHDPDVIATALTAAETGCLVLSALHITGTAHAIERLVEAFPTEQQNLARTRLATVLVGIVFQQLLPCLKEPGLSGETAPSAEPCLSTESVKMDEPGLPESPAPPAKTAQSTGPGPSAQPGLILASEVLAITPAVRSLIREGAYDQIRDLMRNSRDSDTQLMEADLARLYRQGKISLAEAELHAPDPQLLKLFMRS